jgi:CheY-like chemotaxis protein
MEQPKILILVAEDEHLIGMTVQEALADGGFAVQHVDSGDEAMTVVTKNDPELFGIVTDIRLGPGADGWEVARAAREINPLIPIVYMSGDSAHEHPSQGVPDSAMIQKPFAPAQIVTALSTLMNEAQKPTASS